MECVIEEESGIGSRGGDSGGDLGGDHLCFTSDAIVLLRQMIVFQKLR